MEVQGQIDSDWSRCFPQKPFAECHANSRPCCGFRMDTGPVMFKNSNSRSFAMDARIRLDHLKSGSKSPSARCAMNGTFFHYNYEKDVWESEPKEGESVLDSVELLDVDDGEQDEESWLYESPKKLGDKTTSALQWCRHVLDNPSPEMEAACRQLINRLGQNDNKLRITHKSINTNHRLEDITDVCVMARIQEASLRQDYVSTPAAASAQRSTRSPSRFKDDLIAGNKTEASASSHWQKHLPSPRSCSRQSATSVAQQSCQSPKASRLHQQVTQYKLLKLAQSQETARPLGFSCPGRTSLRSLQAVRNRWSSDTDDCIPADPITPSVSGASSSRIGSSGWPPSLSAASMNSSASSCSRRAPSVWMAATKRPHRSLSPCRITQSAKGYLSRHERVFASPERSIPVAWSRIGGPTQR